MANPAARSDAARQSRGGEHSPSGARECVPRALPVGEIFVVLALALSFFGPAKLPALGTSVGAAIRGFKWPHQRRSRDGKANPAAAGPAMTRGDVSIASRAVSAIFLASWQALKCMSIATEKMRTALPGVVDAPLFPPE